MISWGLIEGHGLDCFFRRIKFINTYRKIIKGQEKQIKEKINSGSE